MQYTTITELSSFVKKKFAILSIFINFDFLCYFSIFFRILEKFEDNAPETMIIIRFLKLKKFSPFNFTNI